MTNTADHIIHKLSLSPHPEGGHYRQTWIADAKDGLRADGTCIYFLLKSGEISRWHRIDAVEIWHYYAGAPLILSMAEAKTGPACDYTLGPDVLNGQSPQLVVPEHHWQSARSSGEYTLVGCSVSPAFRFEGFEMMSEDAEIPYG